jgi:hypothetical protein
MSQALVKMPSAKGGKVPFYPFTRFEKLEVDAKSFPKTGQNAYQIRWETKLDELGVKFDSIRLDASRCAQKQLNRLQT